jgi:hypothetical protein
MINGTQIEKSLVEEMGLSGLPEEKQKKLIDKMFEVLLKRIFVETNLKLSEADRKTFGEMINKGTAPEEMEKFLQEKIPNFNEILKNILGNFKDEMLKI